MDTLRQLALASLEICSCTCIAGMQVRRDIGRVVIQFSIRLRHSALHHRMCPWVQFACRVCLARVTPPVLRPSISSTRHSNLAMRSNSLLSTLRRPPCLPLGAPEGADETRTAPTPCTVGARVCSITFDLTPPAEISALSNWRSTMDL
jgi:hypothetical protein